MTGVTSYKVYMHFEVEQKFRVGDITALERRLRELGTAERETGEQVDQYFNHPARDFAHTDEALRLRRVADRNFVTYKGPKLDATTKTRREIELPLPAGDAAAQGFAELLAALGFRPVATVRKTRRLFDVTWQGRTVEVALDDVCNLGTYLELELSTDEVDVEAAKECIASLAAALGVIDNERRSYLELLLQKQQNV